MRRAGLPPKTVEDEICNKLRAMYDGVRHEPVPGQFVDLLEGLDRGTTLALRVPDRQEISGAPLNDPTVRGSRSQAVRHRLKAS